MKITKLNNSVTKWVKYMNGHFITGITWMANRHVKNAQCASPCHRDAEHPSGCSGTGTWSGWRQVTIQRYYEGALCRDRAAIDLDCLHGYMRYTCNKIAQNYTHKHVKIEILKSSKT